MTPRKDFDPGLTQQFTGELRRTINPDGTFNVHKSGSRWRDFNGFLYLTECTWSTFLAIVLAAFLVINTVFASLYLLVKPDLAGTDTGLSRFWTAFFFSVHTLTTVGYGDIYPKGFEPNLVASAEAMAGLLMFALATGLLYGRFSRPSARLIFSKKMLQAPYRDGTSLQFRVANGRNNVLLELDAKVLFMTVDRSVAGPPKRDFADLPLERPNVFFLPLSWTIVHPINEASPVYGKTLEDLAKMEAEFLVLIRAFDDTFSQTVHARFSYRFDEIVWGAKFVPAFYVDKHGDLVLELDRLSECASAKS